MLTSCAATSGGYRRGYGGRVKCVKEQVPESPMERDRNWNATRKCREAQRRVRHGINTRTKDIPHAKRSAPGGGGY